MMDRSEKGTSELGRETLFASLVLAFLERDFATIGQALREDVVLVLPGSSPFAGVHRGAEAVGRFLLGLRQFVISDEKALSYTHEGDELIASNDFLVHGPRHAVEMTMRVRVAFDREGKIGEVFAEPDDVGLFDHVIATAFSTTS
jgi:ketosteroid isomerase-like protein